MAIMDIQPSTLAILDYNHYTYDYQDNQDTILLHQQYSWH